jgi:TolA-binding protein
MLFGAAALLASLAACQTVPSTIPTTLTEPEYFQKAQDAESDGNYAAALKYYDTFLQRFPNDAPRAAEAHYEIAFIYYQKGDLQKAHDLFTALTDDYKKPGSDALPRWPLVLSNKLLITINNELKK